MELGKIVENSFEYTKEGLTGKWVKWIMLTILAVLPAIPMIFMIALLIAAFVFKLSLTLMLLVIAGFIVLIVLFSCPLMGYTVKVFRGETPSPEVENLGSMFIDGLRLFIVQLIYAIPLIIGAVLILGSVLMSTFTPTISGDSSALMKSVPGLVVGILGLLLLAIIIGLIEATACVRFARTNSIGAAFSFGEILRHIGRIGWGSYILALIVLAIIVGIVEMVVTIIPKVGGLLLLILTPGIVLFYSRYLSLLYDNGEPPAAAP